MDDGSQAHHEVSELQSGNPQPEPHRFRGVALVAGADLAGHNKLGPHQDQQPAR